MKRERVSSILCAIGLICGYIALFLAAFLTAGTKKYIAIGFLMAMIIFILAGITLSDYFLDSFKK